MADNSHEIIVPPNTLQSKVSVDEDGVDLEALERAEAVIQAMSGEYLEWVQEDLRQLEAMVARIRKDQTTIKADFDELFRIAHDIKGQGGSFGYDLMTAVGNHLCRFIERLPEPALRDLDVVQVHLDAFKLIIANRMEGDGGADGLRMVKGLQAVVAKRAGG